MRPKRSAARTRRAPLPQDPPPADAGRCTPAGLDPGGAVGRRTLVAVVPVIRAPLPDVAEHVIQPPGIGSFHPHPPGPGARMFMLLLGPITGVLAIVQFQF